VQQLVAVGLGSGQPLGLLTRGHERVVADVGDVTLQPGQFLVAAGRAVDAEQLGLVTVVAPYDRDDRLAGQVTGEQRDVALVDVQRDRVDELPPRLLGGVKIARDVDPGGDG
jgi:hypothetical protein